MTNAKDLAARLRDGTWNLDYLYEAADLIEQQAAEIERLRAALVSFTKSDYIKKQHPKRYAAAVAALKEQA